MRFCIRDLRGVGDPDFGRALCRRGPPVAVRDEGPGGRLQPDHRQQGRLRKGISQNS